MNPSSATNVTLTSLPLAAREVALSPHILLISKTNSKATVHRPSYTDYINRLNRCEEEIESLEDRLARKEGSLLEAKEKIEKFKKMLDYLK